MQYFGGTNFGRTAGGPLVATSYDYDAPIDEYGKISDLVDYPLYFLIWWHCLKDVKFLVWITQTHEI